MCDCDPSSKDPMAVINAINNNENKSNESDHKLFIIGAGLGRTGTSSISKVLNDLGYKTHDCTEIMHAHLYNEWYYISSMTPSLRACLGVWDHLYSNPIKYDAALDFPTSIYCEEIYNYYKSKGQSPKVILTLKSDDNEWYESTKETIYALYKVRRLFYWNYVKKMKKGNTFLNVQWKGFFNGLFENESYAISIYRKHNEHIMKVIPQKDLLVVNINNEKDNEYGYKTIMDFLKIKDKDLRQKYEKKALPHCNKREKLKNLVVMHQVKANRFNAICLTMAVLTVSILGYVGYNAYESNKKK